MRHDDINSKAISLIEEYALSKSSSILQELYFLILPISRQRIRVVISKLHLSKSSADDMEQEAFIKLQAIIDQFDIRRGQDFTAWWKRCLYNHLLSLNYSKHHKVNCIVEPEVYDKIELDSVEILNKIKNKLEDEVNRWKSPIDKKIAKTLIEKRIFALPGKEITQRDLEKELELSQGFISLWDKWLRKKLREIAISSYDTDII